MNRRELLEWASRGIAAGIAAVVGLPGFRYLLAGIEPASASQAHFERVIRFKDLVPGRPAIVPVMGQKRDAWMRHDQQVIGRVWVVRDPEAVAGEAGLPEANQVRVLSSTCPHMGCQLQTQAGGKGFVCPCHRAAFGLQGDRQSDPKTGGHNHAPRDLDALNCRVVQEPATGEYWVEVQFQKFETGQEQQIATV